MSFYKAYSVVYISVKGLVLRYLQMIVEAVERLKLRILYR